MSKEKMTGATQTPGTLADYGMLYLPGSLNGAYTIQPGTNVFALGGTLTENSPSVTLVKPMTTNAAMQLANAGTYWVRMGVCVAVVPPEGYVFRLYVNENPNYKKVNKFASLGCRGATVPSNLMNDMACILTLPANARLSLFSSVDTTIQLNSLKGIGGPAAYITVCRFK